MCSENKFEVNEKLMAADSMDLAREILETFTMLKNAKYPVCAIHQNDSRVLV